MPSEKILEQKKKVVKALVERFNTSKSVILTDYRGLTVEEDTELRRALRKDGVYYRVVKNSLMSFAIKECGYDELEQFIEGPIAIATHDEDPVIAAKVLSDFAKKYTSLKLKAGVVEGRVMGADEVAKLAALPSKEELIARALAGFNAPIASFVNVLNANIRGLAIVLKEIADKKAEQKSA